MSIPSINPANTQGFTFTGVPQSTDTNVFSVSITPSDTVHLGNTTNLIPESTSFSLVYSGLPQQPTITDNTITISDPGSNVIIGNDGEQLSYYSREWMPSVNVTGIDVSTMQQITSGTFTNSLNPLVIAGDRKSPRKRTGADCDTYETRITPLVDGKSIFPMARQMIRQAKESIALEMYRFSTSDLSGWEDVPGRTDAQYFKDQAALVDELVKAANRGVKVQVLLDSSKGINDEMGNKAVADYLKANGVQVILYPKQAVNIDHVKLLVVDNFRAMVGGMNWGEHSPVNHDANILIEGREAAELKSQIFDPAVRFAGKHPSKTIVNEEREDKIDVLETRPVEHDGGETTIRDNLLNYIAAAEKSIHAEMFCLTCPEVVTGLIDAHERGVDVKILLDPNMDLINRGAFAKLEEAGVPVRWYTVDVDKAEKLHGKWATIDSGELFIGSANWTGNGLDASIPGDRTNHEAAVIVRDESINSYFERVFDNDWKNRSSKEMPPHKICF